MLKRALPSLLFLALSTAALGQDASPPPKPAEVRALFLANCAQCHGEKGDGEGVTQLDRKARSFLDGGFSYGNTREAILRSITHGIPGTPMPSFEKALTDAQRDSLTKYVIAFGPDQIVVDPSESEMVVKDRPLVVRGKLPPIVEGAGEWSRGLAIGTPDGLTFEYRADDVQLIGVRAGRFVNRTDWGDRGGSALEMLGKVVWNAQFTPDVQRHFVRIFDGYPASPEIPAERRLMATEVRDGSAWIEYEVRALSAVDKGPTRIRESVRAMTCSLGSGFARRMLVRVPDGRRLAITQPFGRKPSSMLLTGGRYSDWMYVYLAFSKDRTQIGEVVAVVVPLLTEVREDEDSVTVITWSGARTNVGGEQSIEVFVFPAAKVTEDETMDVVQVIGRLAESLPR